MAERIRPRLWNRTDPDRPRKCMSIMRPNKLSNPFHRGNCPDRTERIARFEDYVRSQRKLMALIARLDDVDLVCCCAPMPCHGDVILRIWDELNTPVDGGNPSAAHVFR